MKVRDSFLLYKHKYFPTALFVLWMLVIFFFSMENGENSSDTSGGVIGLIGRFLHPDFVNWTPEAQFAFIERLSYPIRKAAHMTEYAILGILGLWTFWAWKQPMRRAVLSAFFCGVSYAATDELHQLFVPGRSGQVTDVLIDSVGVFLGLALALFVLYRRSRRRNSRSG